MSNDSDKVKEQIKELLIQLENKNTKKAIKQKSNIEVYLKDQGEDIDEIKKEIDKTKENEKRNLNRNKIPNNFYIKEHNYKPTKKERLIDDEGNIYLSKNPFLIFVQIENINKEWYFKYMEEAEKLNIYCIAYPIFKYKAIRHGVLPVCDICYYGFTEQNLFCEYIIKISRLAGYGFKGIQLENIHWKLGELS